MIGRRPFWGAGMFQELFNGLYAADELTGRLAGNHLSQSKSSKPQKKPQKVLVVDDHKLITDTLCDILVSSGFHGIAAYDAWTALDLIERFHPDYLLSDVLMPNMNGVELAIAVRKMYPATKILLFSGQAGISEILEDGQKQGFVFELMPKPIHPIKLIERLGQLK